MLCDKTIPRLLPNKSESLQKSLVRFYEVILLSHAWWSDRDAQKNQLRLGPKWTTQMPYLEEVRHKRERVLCNQS